MGSDEKGRLALLLVGCTLYRGYRITAGGYGNDMGNDKEQNLHFLMDGLLQTASCCLL